MKGRTISKKDMLDVDNMTKSQLSNYIMNANQGSGKYRYAIREFIKRRK